MLYYGSSGSQLFRVTVLLIGGLALARSGGAQGDRKVVARFAATGTAQGYVFTDGEAKVPDDAQLRAFETALRGLTFTVYSDDTFDLQSGAGSFVFAFTGGRVGRSVDGIMFLHFRADLTTTLISSLDGVFYPAGADPQANPARLTFSFTQAVPGTRGTLTWHTIAAVKSVP
jgi:hypothetical protein